MSAKSEAMKRLRARRRRMGKCVQCGAPADWSYRCAACEAKRVTAQRARRARQRAQRETQ